MATTDLDDILFHFQLSKSLRNKLNNNIRLQPLDIQLLKSKARSILKAVDKVEPLGCVVNKIKSTQKDNFNF
jgi:hypothetical protein